MENIFAVDPARQNGGILFLWARDMQIGERDGLLIKLFCGVIKSRKYVDFVARKMGESWQLTISMVIIRTTP
ncbi:MAG: hypothetical protein FJY98_01060 [Candidatus Liptonbacteria bacterium]|nr:hypothetical protein [Candidatus Liptonbacteria bacterium]